MIKNDRQGKFLVFQLTFLAYVEENVCLNPMNMNIIQMLVIKRIQPYSLYAYQDQEKSVDIASSLNFQNILNSAFTAYALCQHHTRNGVDDILNFWIHLNLSCHTEENCFLFVF